MTPEALRIYSEEQADDAVGLYPREYLQLIKYMGSKAQIIDFVVDGLRVAHSGGVVCDLFAGACSLSGALGNQVPIVNNDIQEYSRVLAHVYLHRISKRALAITGDMLANEAGALVEKRLKQIPHELSYPKNIGLKKFNELEVRNRLLIKSDFPWHYHLFVKNYSGTWWSAEQCLWIDALREVADKYLDEGKINEGDRCIIFSCVMHAMAYCGQGTGHFAQYRDAKSQSSLKDINLYRQKSMRVYFSRKFDQIKQWNKDNVFEEHKHQFLALDYVDCLSALPEGGTVYADPPYAFVHYSRFYHAIETFVLYDFPELQIKGGSLVKGRYREERHQSPFSIKSQVPGAFRNLFRGIRDKSLNLVLSYSDTGLLDLEHMSELAQDELGRGYKIEELVRKGHTHKTMGRKADDNRQVEEALLIAKKK